MKRTADELDQLFEQVSKKARHRAYDAKVMVRATVTPIDKETQDSVHGVCSVGAVFVFPLSGVQVATAPLICSPKDRKAYKKSQVRLFEICLEFSATCSPHLKIAAFPRKYLAVNSSDLSKPEDFSCVVNLSNCNYVEGALYFDKNGIVEKLQIIWNSELNKGLKELFLEEQYHSNLSDLFETAKMLKHKFAQ